MAHQNDWILVVEAKVKDKIYNPNIGSEHFLAQSQLTSFVVVFWKYPQ